MWEEQKEAEERPMVHLRRAVEPTKRETGEKSSNQMGILGSKSAQIPIPFHAIVVAPAAICRAGNSGMNA